LTERNERAADVAETEKTSFDKYSGALVCRSGAHVVRHRLEFVLNMPVNGQPV